VSTSSHRGGGGHGTEPPGHAHGHGHGHAGHGHGHGHPHPHAHLHGATIRAERTKDRKRLLGALVFTSIIALAEGVGGYLTNSLALLSDAGHMLTDVSAIGLVLLALWFASKPANVKKTYGYYRLEILSALLNGIVLLGITVYIVWEAVERFRSPQQVDVLPMLGIAAVGLLANLVALSFLHKSHSMSVRGAFLHVLGDTLSSVGVMVGGAVMWWTGWMIVDPLISLLISVVIVIGAYRLVRDAVDVLLEATPAHVDMDALRALMLKVPGVVGVHDLHVWTISSGIYALSAHLVVPDPLACNNDEILSAVKHDLYDRYGIDHTTIQIESETYAHLGEVH
jgi:cobalt-zinc-cadmium efflux system protein